MRTFIRRFRLLIVACLLLLGYALAGFLLIPYIIKSYVFPKIAEQLKHPVLVREVHLNPFLLSLQLTGFEIREPDQSPLIGFEEFFVDFETISLIRQAYVFDTIRLTMPFVSVKVAQDGRVNLVGLIPPAEPGQAEEPPKTAGKSEIPAVEIGHLEISKGIVEFRDDSKPRPFTMDIVPIGIVLQDFHTRPGGENKYAFTAELEKGESLEWEGTVSIDPIRSDGKLRLAGIRLPSLWEYARYQFRFDITSGTLGAEGRYHFDTTTAPPRVTIADASVKLQNVAVTEQGFLDPVISLPLSSVEDIQADMTERTVTISAFKMVDAVWNAWLNQDGTVNYQTLFAPVEPPVQSSTTSQPAPQSSDASKEKPWTVLIKQVALDNHAVHFEDRTLNTPARTDITNLTVRTKDVPIPIHGTVPLAVGMMLNGSGQVRIDGEVSLKPIDTDISVSLKNIAIQPYQPYLDRFSTVVVESGAIDVDGRLHLSLEHPKSPLLTYEGNFGIKSLGLADGEGTQVASWKQLQLQRIALSLDPTAITIDEVALDQPSIQAVIKSDGRLNLSQLASKTGAADTASPAKQAGQPKKAPPPPVAIKTVKILKGSAMFRDESIQPTVRTGIQDLTGTIKGLSSKQMAKADVALSAKVDKVAPLKISGAINPLAENAFTDLSISFENVDLTAATPYSGKYVGYPIRKGKLFLDLAYKVSQKQLEAENKVKVDQLTFGEKTDSPDATSLPVPLAIALLKDRKGLIDIDLPIRGDLNDPDFKYGKVVISTLLNLLTKMVASPFALMGKLVPGGDSDDLQFIEFPAGSSTLPPDEGKKAETLVKGLEERPGLRLDVTGAADPRRDAEALKRRKLAEQIRAKSGRAQSFPATPLTPDEEQRVVKELYDEYKRMNGTDTRAESPQGRQSVPTVDDMKRELVAAMPSDEEQLRTLARDRAEAIRSALTGDGKLPEERVYLVEADLSTSDHDMVRSKLNITAGP
ncbi:MAG TPA: DUF748 domain-containing protein [Nitrospira sp.]|nr:DUF748 domain-containing protein [Nitrospira sp.]